MTTLRVSSTTSSSAVSRRSRRSRAPSAAPARSCGGSNGWRAGASRIVGGAIDVRHRRRRLVHAPPQDRRPRARPSPRRTTTAETQKSTHQRALDPAPPGAPRGASTDWTARARDRVAPRVGSRRLARRRGFGLCGAALASTRGAAPPCRRCGPGARPAGPARSASARTRRSARPARPGSCPRNDGMPFGRPSTIVAKMFAGVAAVDPLVVHQRRAHAAAAVGVAARCSCTRVEPLALAHRVGVLLVGAAQARRGQRCRAGRGARSARSPRSASLRPGARGSGAPRARRPQSGDHQQRE